MDLDTKRRIWASIATRSTSASSETAVGKRTRSEGLMGPGRPPRRASSGTGTGSEATSVDITGRYEAVDPEQRRTLQINQAGKHFVGWMQHHATAKHIARIDDVVFSGDLAHDTGSVVTFSYDIDTKRGALTAHRVGDELRLNLVHGSVIEFRRISDAPRLSDDAIASLPPEARPLAHATETAPFDAVEKALLKKTASDLEARIEAWIDARTPTRRDEIAALLIAPYVADLFDDPAVDGDGDKSRFAPEQAAAVRAWLSERLIASAHRTGSTTMSHWDWLSIALAKRPDVAGLLGIRGEGPDASKPNKYRWRMIAWSEPPIDGDGKPSLGPISFGAYITPLEITQVEGDGAGWTARLWVAYAELGVGAMLEVGEIASGTLESTYPLRAGNFRGFLHFTSASIDLGKSKGGSYIIFDGDGAFGPISGALDDGKTPKLGFEVSTALGYVFSDRDESMAWAKPRAKRRADGGYATGGRACFGVDVATLTEDGRRSLREMCAVHRAALTDSKSAITVIGYASPTAGDAYNFALSMERVKNTIAAIDEIIDPPGIAMPIAVGESAARVAGIPDGTEAAEWRKVDVLVHGRVATTLRY
jgi:hypothetical protein